MALAEAQLLTVEAVDGVAIPRRSWTEWLTGGLKTLPWSPSLGVLEMLLHRRWGPRLNLLPNLCELMKRPCDVQVHSAICAVWLASRLSYSALNPSCHVLLIYEEDELIHDPEMLGGSF